jgi:hypothetical protein
MVGIRVENSSSTKAIDFKPPHEGWVIPNGIT